MEELARGMRRNHVGTDGEASVRGREDDIERALLEVQSLVRATVAKHRRRTSRKQLTTVLKPVADEIQAASEQLAHGAVRAVDAVVAEPAYAARTYAVLRELVRERRGSVRARILCVQATLDRDLVEELARSGQPNAVRIARIPRMEAMIADGRSALVCAEMAGERQACVLRVSPETQVIHNLFGTVWKQAVDANAWIGLGEHTRVELVQQILHYLRTGATDEVASRKLSISVRTYRRHIATIMELLDAKSRFQAGVRAAELGLLTGLPPVPDASRGWAPAGRARCGCTPPPDYEYFPDSVRAVQRLCPAQRCTGRPQPAMGPGIALPDGRTA